MYIWKYERNQLDRALRESKVVVNLHQYDDDNVLNQIKLHEMMRYNLFIVNEMPSEYEEEMITNYRCCIEFVEQVKKDLSNISSLFSIIDDLVAKANLKTATLILNTDSYFKTTTRGYHFDSLRMILKSYQLILNAQL